MKGIILINAYSKDQPWVRQAERLKEEFSLLGVECDIVKNDGFKAYIHGGKRISLYGDIDFAVYLDKDKYISRVLEDCGVRLYNRHGAIRDCDDKFNTFIRLAESGLRLPDTLPGLLCYDKGERVSEDALDIIEDRLDYPVVVKTSYGSMGKGVYLCKSRAELREASRALLNVPHIYQKFVSESYGKDIRVIVIGGRARAVMRRVNNGDFRSNAARGGTGERVNISEEYTIYAEKCARLIGLDYCGVDLFETPEGPVVCEVNSNAFFEEAERATGINIAREYCKYIVNDVRSKG